MFKPESLLKERDTKYIGFITKRSYTKALNDEDYYNYLTSVCADYNTYHDEICSRIKVETTTTYQHVLNESNVQDLLVKEQNSKLRKQIVPTKKFFIPSGEKTLLKDVITFHKDVDTIVRQQTKQCIANDLMDTKQINLPKYQEVVKKYNVPLMDKRAKEFQIIKQQLDIANDLEALTLNGTCAKCILIRRYVDAMIDSKDKVALLNILNT